MKLAEQKSCLELFGLDPERVCTQVAVVPHAENAVQVINGREVIENCRSLKFTTLGSEE